MQFRLTKIQSRKAKAAFHEGKAYFPASNPLLRRGRIRKLAAVMPKRIAQLLADRGDECFTLRLQSMNKT